MRVPRDKGVPDLNDCSLVSVCTPGCCFSLVLFYSRRACFSLFASTEVRPVNNILGVLVSCMGIVFCFPFFVSFLSCAIGVDLLLLPLWLLFTASIWFVHHRNDNPLPTRQAWCLNMSVKTSALHRPTNDYGTLLAAWRHVT